MPVAQACPQIPQAESPQALIVDDECFAVDAANLICSVIVLLERAVASLACQGALKTTLSGMVEAHKFVRLSASEAWRAFGEATNDLHPQRTGQPATRRAAQPRTACGVDRHVMNIPRLSENSFFLNRDQKMFNASMTRIQHRAYHDAFACILIRRNNN